MLPRPGKLHLFIEHLLHAGPVTLPQCLGSAHATWLSHVLRRPVLFFVPVWSWVAPRAEPKEGLGADSLLGRAPRGLCEGRERETEKEEEPKRWRVEGMS